MFRAMVLLLAAGFVLAVSAFALVRWRGEQRGSSGFVTRAGQRLLLDGERFRFVGANMYNAAGDPAIYQCGPWMDVPDEELDGWFRRARHDFGARVVRFWAFQSYTRGGEDWRALDRVIRLARRHELKLIPVLENQWTECSEGGVKTAAWYADGYTRPYGAYPLSYVDYVTRIVTRYRDEPAIVAWMLINEAETKRPDGSGDPATLLTFTETVSALVKRLDAQHLVTLGLIGTGQPGTSGTAYERLHAVPTVDFLDYHDYGADDEPLPGGSGGRQNTLAYAFEVARRLQKPLVLGEAGMNTCAPLEGFQLETQEGRARKFDAKLAAFFAAGGAGYLIWTWNPDESCELNFTTGDPLNTVLRRHAGEIARSGAGR